MKFLTPAEANAPLNGGGGLQPMSPSSVPGANPGPVATPDQPDRPDLQPSYVVTQGDIAEMEKK